MSSGASQLPYQVAVPLVQAGFCLGLHNPRDIPDSRFNLDRFYHLTGSHHGTTNICQAYLLSEDTLSDAITDGDHIEAVIRKAGVNHDGRTKGLIMPSATAQAALIRDIFEAHGTKSKAGDPQEAEALMKAFFPEPDSQGEPFVGSIKTVIGHGETGRSYEGLSCSSQFNRAHEGHTMKGVSKANGTNGANRTNDLDASDLSSANGANCANSTSGIPNTDTEITASLNNGPVVIEEKLENKTLNGTLPIILV
ncbi:thiolase-like protein [Aspergillus oleicola]